MVAPMTSSGLGPLASDRLGPLAHDFSLIRGAGPFANPADPFANFDAI